MHKQVYGQFGELAVINGGNKMGYRLDKPYTETERADFIVRHNHEKGLKIEETENAIFALEAWEKLVGDNIYDNSTEYEAELVKRREEEFNQEFFLTSLGYIRRQVNMATGEKKDFLSDLLPTISMAVQGGQEVPIITYKQPDFTEEFDLGYLESLQEVKLVTLDFVQECAMQLSKDFLTTPLTVMKGD